jgi:MFS transporter, MHS family, proline/betaine transporter
MPRPGAPLDRPLATDVLDRPEGRGMRRNVLAATVGNALEWYDFAVYGFLAPIIGRQFFPAEDAVASLLAAFGALAIGYAARPVGGVIFGHLGDRLGRKPALVISVLAMGAATFAIGILPDHEQIGTSAAALLVIFRIVQGLSVGGEYAGSIVFMAEHAPPARRGFYASWPQFGTLIGFLLGSAIGALTSTILGQAVMEDWGWRVPFLLGVIIAIAGLIFRRHLDETPVARRMSRAAGFPLVVVFRDHWRPVLRLISLILVGGIGFYMVFVYAAASLTEQGHLTTAEALDINSISLLFMLVLTAPVAILSDRIGRKPMMAAVALGALIFAWPCWWLMQQQDFWSILAGQLGFALLFAIAFAVIPSVMSELLPADIRCSGASIGYNLCLGLVGGTTPLVATYLVAETGDVFAPVYYLMAAAALQLVGVIGMTDLARQPLPHAA